MELIEGKFYECKQTFSFKYNAHFLKSKRYEATSDFELKDEFGDNFSIIPRRLFGVEEGFFETHFYSTDYPSTDAPKLPIAGTALPKEPEQRPSIPKKKSIYKAPDTQNLPRDPSAMKTLADEAYELIGGDRLEEYGDMRRSFENIGKVWSVLLGVEVPAEKVALMMVGLKLVRENNKHKRDNLVDLIGYTALLGRLEGEE